MINFQSKNINEVLSILESNKEGLSQKQVDEKIKKVGFNELKEETRVHPFKIFLSQFKSFIVGILIVTMIISFMIHEYVQGIAITVILLLNAIIGFRQEYKAEKAIQALKKMASLKAVVFRDGKEVKIDTKFLVPGDIIILETGEKVPADSRIIESNNLQTLEAALTGESLPIKKHAEVLSQNIPIADMKNMIFSSTIIVSGRGKAIVTNTGMNTQIGHIAKMIQSEKPKLTPLQKNLKKLGEYMGIAAIVVSFIVFFTGIAAGIDTVEMFMTAISLAVAAIPEGLPAVVTLALGLGIVRMIKKNALIRKLPSVETLGSTSVICTDKTGTLTMNQMTVRKIFANDQIITVTGRGYEKKGNFFLNEKKVSPKNLTKLLEIGALCNDAKLTEKEVIGDPTEGCLIVSAAKAGFIRDDLENKYPRIGEMGFTSERKRMSTLHKINNKKVVYCKGAPDIILDLCDRIYKNGKIERLTRIEKKKILSMNETFAKQALRVLGFAYKESDKIDESNMIFVGLQSMIDPPRPEVKDEIEKCRSAGIKVIMITGDYKLTAQAIGKELGLTGHAIDGKELEKIPNLEDHVEEISIYARVDPKHKARILEALQKKVHIVAMTGDGVNDAPAIKKADIGISMGITGTDVAKEASDMILTDDNFNSIVNAVEEGRAIYDNIKKFVYYLLSSNIGEILTIFTALLIGLPLPLVALQILWINLVTDGLPALALGVDPADPDIMALPPRDPKENIINKTRAFTMFTIGTVMMIGTLLLFNHYDPHTNLVYAQTAAFTCLMMFQMFNVLNSKSEKHSLFEVGIFSNPKLIGAILISIALQIFVIYVPFMEHVFETAALKLVDWGIIILVSSSVLVVAELIKLYLRKRDVK